MNPIELIQKYYGDSLELENILLRHSADVARRAVRISVAHPEFQIDNQFLFEAAMLHDIGIFMVDAPSICCHGSRPYICHGILGAELLRSEGLEAHARVAERHTGTGLTCEQILREKLPLPPRDYVPETLVEKIVCYADKFYSKSHLDIEKTPQQAIQSLQKFGQAGVDKFKSWMDEFE